MQVGDIRIDADTVTNAPAGADRTHSVAEMVTAYSYDADNRVLDTVQGAQMLQADPDEDDSALAVPDPGGRFEASQV